jgi:plastocyanin
MRLPIGAAAPLLALVLAAAPAPLNSLRAQPAAPAVRIANFTFAPRTLVVPVGTTVTWSNDDDVPHTVVATDGSFRSKPLDTGDKFSVTFNAPGEHAYFCSIHPMMTGKLVVKG